MYKPDILNSFNLLTADITSLPSQVDINFSSTGRGSPGGPASEIFLRRPRRNKSRRGTDLPTRKDKSSSTEFFSAGSDSTSGRPKMMRLSAREITLASLVTLGPETFLASVLTAAVQELGGGGKEARQASALAVVALEFAISS